MFQNIPWEEAFAVLVLVDAVHQLKAGPESVSTSPAHIGLSLSHTIHRLVDLLE